MPVPVHMCVPWRACIFSKPASLILGTGKSQSFCSTPLLPALQSGQGLAGGNLVSSYYDFVMSMGQGAIESLIN